MARLIVVGALALGVALAGSLLIGAEPVAPAQVLRAVRGNAADPTVQAIVTGRWVRTVVGVLVGVYTALSGVALQALTRNPIADPGILGLNAGAALAVVLGITVAHISAPGQYVWFALVGVLVAAALVLAVSSTVPVRRQPVTMALVGAAISAAATSGVSALVLTDDGALDSFRSWQVGSVAGRDQDQVLQVLPFLLLGAVGVLSSGRILNLLALGDDLARSLGSRLVPARLGIGLAAALLCAGATAIAGPIGFVGLAVPHAVRRLVGGDHRRVLLGACFAGPVLVLVADTLGRIALPPGEVPVGIVTAVLGAPVLLLVARRAVA